MRTALIMGMIALAGLEITIVCLRTAAFAQQTPPALYPLHVDVTATLFWIGEDTKNPNTQSAWDMKWMEHYGGIDEPARRNGYYPAAFTPKENPFYCALPYTDFDTNGRKANTTMIPWANTKRWGRRESMCKNQWVRISTKTTVVYAQWEDCGPFETDDAAYVFGAAKVKNTHNQCAGIDVSPAVHDYLGLDGIDRVNWQFVNSADVPDGPWKAIITDSQITWE